MAPLAQAPPRTHRPAPGGLEASPGTRERRLFRGLALPWRLAMPVLFALGWCASTGIGVDVADQFTVFGAAGAVLFTLLSGFLLARFTPASTQAA